MTEFWEKLVNFAAGEGITIIKHDRPSVAGFIGTSTPTRPWRINIYNCSATTTEEQVYTLAHEIGHIIDVRKRGVEFRYELAKQLMLDGEYLDERMQQVIIDREKAATDYGRKLLELLGLNDLTAYDKDAVENIDFYTLRFEEGNQNAALWGMFL